MDPQGRGSVADVMSRGAITIAPGASVRSARVLMNERGIEHLLVTDGGRLVGVVCTCDLDRVRPDRPISSCMTEEVQTVAETASLDETARIMRERPAGCLPVTSDDRLLGIVTRRDLERAGFPIHEVGPTCATCGAHRHVYAPQDLEQPQFCRPCLEEPEPRDESELAAGD